MGKKKEILVPTNLAEALKFYRDKQGITHQQIADNLQIHRSTYTCYESGKTQPSLENIKKIARLFNVSPEALFYYDKPVTTSLTKVNDPGLDDIFGNDSMSDLTKKERDLILCFRSLTDAQQNDWLEAIKASRKPSKKNNKPSDKKEDA